MRQHTLSHTYVLPCPCPIDLQITNPNPKGDREILIVPEDIQ